MTDELRNLVERLRAGDEAAFEEAVRRFTALVFAQAYSVVGNSHDARDVCQDVFISLYRKVDTIRKPSALKGFLRTAARNRALDILRKKKGGGVSLDALGEVEHENDEPDPSSEIERQEEKVQRKQLVSDAITQLPKDQQEVIKLRYEKRLSYAQIAKELNTGLAVVRGRLYRAHKALAGKLGSHFPE
ncbi:MAG: sigma-70 family RNA polymerase sigma factor [Planctomycetota bacterium]|nr:sigma-70 family RNA polymerase sigma factor [Planctomycetota bacterium]